MTIADLNFILASFALTAGVGLALAHKIWSRLRIRRISNRVRLRSNQDLGESVADADTPPPLVPEYHKARAEVVISAGFLLLWRAGIPFKAQLPVLSIHVSERTTLPLLAVVLSYGVCRLLIEWLQSPPARRRRPASKIDFLLTLAIAGAGFWSFAEWKGLHLEMPAPSLLIVGAGLAGFGIYMAGRVSLLALDLLLIRSRDEARRLALPRTPVATRALLLSALTTVPAFLLLLVLTPAFASPISDAWPWIFGVPALSVFVADVMSLLVVRRVGARGERRSFSEFIRAIRRIHDRHDVRYQIGGWDKPIPPHNAPLYDAAARGDIDGVRRFLHEGADANGLNMHGWTALAIAAAQRHREVANVLLAFGANPNIPNLLGRTALMFAARYGDVDLVRGLLGHGADVNLNESDDYSALGAAAVGGHVEVVRLLLEAGGDPASVDFAGRTPEQHAEEARQGACAAILRKARLERRARPH